jgi:hypothetical protein
LAELEEIFWICEIKIVEIMHDWCYCSQEDKQQIGTQAATECEEQATETLQANRHHQ